MISGTVTPEELRSTGLVPQTAPSFTVTILFEIGHSRDEIVSRSHISDLIDSAQLKATVVFFEQTKPIEGLVQLITEFIVAEPIV